VQPYRLSAGTPIHAFLPIVTIIEPQSAARKVSDSQWVEDIAGTRKGR
jgi:hypothetical protein